MAPLHILKLRKPEPDFSDFSESECNRRVTRASRAMKDRDLDALFLTRPINMYYMCGLQNTPAQHTIGWPYGLIVKRDGEMSLVLRGGMGDVARASSYVHSITEYRKRGDFAETMKAAFASAGLKSANVGAE